MALKLMYITNQPQIAQIAESSGVDRIFVDMEYIGKAERQGGLDSVQNYHTIEDIRVIKQAVQSAEVLVRVNPIHEATAEYTSSKEEIDAAVAEVPEEVMETLQEAADRIAFYHKAQLREGYTLKEATAVDMFPRTCHVESVVLMSRGG